MDELVQQHAEELDSLRREHDKRLQLAQRELVDVRAVAEERLRKELQVITPLAVFTVKQ